MDRAFRRWCWRNQNSQFGTVRLTQFTQGPQTRNGNSFEFRTLRNRRGCFYKREKVFEMGHNPTENVCSKGTAPIPKCARMFQQEITGCSVIQPQIRSRIEDVSDVKKNEG